MKPVADEAGRGYTCGTSRGAGATYARSRAPAQPAPRSTCTASPYTPRPAGRAQRDSVGAGCGRAAGQVSWRRVGSVGRFDRLWHTDGRPFVRGAHQWLWQLGRYHVWPCSLNAQGNAAMRGAHYIRSGAKNGTMSSLLSQMLIVGLIVPTMSPSALIIEQ